MRVLVEPVRHIREGKEQVYLRPGPNRRLERAIALYGRPIYPTGSGSAGRTYEQQAYYYDQFKNHGGPVAANPKFGRRPHMRFGAIDIDDPGATGAMLAAGWVATTPSEWWHFEDPDMVRAAPFFRGWPIVTSFYTAQKEDDDMRLIRREGNTPEWSLFHPTLRGPSELERGYIVVADPEVAKGLARTWADGFGTEKSEPRDVYVGLQAAARWAYDRNVQPGATNLKPVLDAIAQVPTAQENGQAARAAIVK